MTSKIQIFPSDILTVQGLLVINYVPVAHTRHLWGLCLLLHGSQALSLQCKIDWTQILNSVYTKEILFTYSFEV